MLSAINAVLTLPGIAGIILSVGMAVDANVLIFERIREELRDGKRLRSAMDVASAGLLKLFGLQPNNADYCHSVVLCGYRFGAGGFAVTLGIGILASMFTAIVVTRAI